MQTLFFCKFFGSVLYLLTKNRTYSLCFGSDAFVNWLNQQVLDGSDNQARIVNSQYPIKDNTLPILNL